VTTRVTVTGASQLGTAVRLLRGVDRDVRRQVTTELRRVLPPAWAREVDDRARTRQDRAVLGGAKVRLGGTTPKLVSATRPTSSGARIWRQVEFGDGNKTYVTYRGNVWRNRGVQITRRTQEQLPDRNRRGRVLYRAVSAMGPRIYSLWSQTVIRTVYDALRGGTTGGR
jgi:hypothetical protein